MDISPYECFYLKKWDPKSARALNIKQQTCKTEGFRSQGALRKSAVSWASQTTAEVALFLDPCGRAKEVRGATAEALRPTKWGRRRSSGEMTAAEAKAAALGDSKMGAARARGAASDSRTTTAAMEREIDPGERRSIRESESEVTAKRCDINSNKRRPLLHLIGPNSIGSIKVYWTRSSFCTVHGYVLNMTGHVTSFFLELAQ